MAQKSEVCSEKMSQDNYLFEDAAWFDMLYLLQ